MFSKRGSHRMVDGDPAVRGGGLPDPRGRSRWVRPNYMLTLNALRVLKGAGRISIALSAHP
jgi:hypothetical protein